MNRADCPPGHRMFRFGDNAGGPFLAAEPVLQRGPRIGTRLWLIVHIDHHRVWSHAMLKRVEVPEFTQVVMNGGHQWYLGCEPQP